jgi:hypothetical protein
LEARRFDGSAKGPTPLIDFQGARDFPLAGVCKGRKTFHTDDVHNGHFMPKDSIIMPDILYAIPSIHPFLRVQVAPLPAFRLCFLSLNQQHEYLLQHLR